MIKEFVQGYKKVHPKNIDKAMKEILFKKLRRNIGRPRKVYSHFRPIVFAKGKTFQYKVKGNDYTVAEVNGHYFPVQERVGLTFYRRLRKKKSAFDFL